MSHPAGAGRAETRIAALARHLTLAMETYNTDVPSSHAFDPADLYSFITADHAELRAEVFEFLKDPIFAPNNYLTIPEYRDLTLERLKMVCDQKFFSVRDYSRDPLKFMAVLEVLAYCDYSLAIKGGVHFTLCGGTLNKLGTKKHHDRFFEGMDDLSLAGCFGMTELGHGSNVMGIETTAEFDEETGGFVINTPNDQASKFWIGGAALHARICTVFAQLTVKGQYQGPHAFIVRLRDDHHRLVAGVRIEDNGAKAGLNGVDNGRIWFSHVQVPLDSLLDRFAQVDSSGTYRSSIPTVSARFGATVGGLTTGRMLIAQAAVDATKIGLAIAIRYSCRREQFGGRVIMSYLTHQLRLLPGLAAVYVEHCAMNHLKRLAVGAAASDAKAVHVLSSGLKAACTWTRADLLQKCREACGGMGFLAANKIGSLLRDFDVDVTFEGDNTVLMTQVAKALTEGAANAAPPVPTPPEVPAGAEGNLRWLLALLQYREDSLVALIGTAMHRARVAGRANGAAAAAAAFDANLDLVVQLGWAHVERSSLEQFAATIDEAPEALRYWMGRLASLYGLTRVDAAAAFHLAAGSLAGPASGRVRAAVKRICAELVAPRAGGEGMEGCAALALCDGFGIPDHCISAPIAFDAAI